MAVIRYITLNEPPLYVKTRGKIKHRLMIRQSRRVEYEMSDWSDGPLWSGAVFIVKPLAKAQRRRTNRKKKSGGRRHREFMWNGKIRWRYR